MIKWFKGLITKSVPTLDDFRIRCIDLANRYHCLFPIGDTSYLLESEKILICECRGYSYPENRNLKIYLQTPTGDKILYDTSDGFRIYPDLVEFSRLLDIFEEHCLKIEIERKLQREQKLLDLTKEFQSRN